MGDRSVPAAAKDQHPQEDEMGFYRAHSVSHIGALQG